MNVPPRIEVDWLDSQGSSRWRPLPEAMREAEADDLLHCSMGYLLDDGERYLLLAASYREEQADGPEMVADVIQIPRPAVVEVRSLSAGRKR